MPALNTLGLHELAEEIEKFIGYFERVDNQTQEQIDAYFEFCKGTYEKLISLGLNEIPQRLDIYLQG